MLSRNVLLVMPRLGVNLCALMQAEHTNVVVDGEELNVIAVELELSNRWSQVGRWSSESKVILQRGLAEDRVEHTEEAAPIPFISDSPAIVDIACNVLQNFPRHLRRMKVGISTTPGVWRDA